MTEGKCAIWGTPSTLHSYYDNETHDSPRAGGKYKITGSAKAVFEANYNNDIKFKLKLTSWLVEQRHLGSECPVIDSNLSELITPRRGLTTSGRIENFLFYCLSRNIRIGDVVVKFSSHAGLSVFPVEVLAWTESSDAHDYLKFSKFISEAGYLSDGSLTLKAYNEIENLERKSIDSKKAFVAMWFDPSVNQIYEEAIAPAIRDAGFEPIRIDRKEHNNKIDDEIIAELRRSRFVIADFTSAILEREGRPEAIARGGVYYEAGFAHGMRIPVIWTCRSDMISLVHFDTRQYNHIDWKDAADLKKRLYDRIRATIT